MLWVYSSEHLRFWPDGNSSYAALQTCSWWDSKGPVLANHSLPALALFLSWHCETYYLLNFSLTSESEKAMAEPTLPSRFMCFEGESKRSFAIFKRQTLIVTAANVGRNSTGVQARTSLPFRLFQVRVLDLLRNKPWTIGSGGSGRDWLVAAAGGNFNRLRCAGIRMKCCMGAAGAGCIVGLCVGEIQWVVRVAIDNTICLSSQEP